MEFITALDTALLWHLHNLLQCSLLDAVMPWITALGDHGLIWILLTLILLIFKPTRRAGAAMAMAMLLCYLVGNLGIKPLVARARPYQADPAIALLIPRPDEFSFPSGHTMNSFAAASALASSHKKYGWAALFLALLISFSRLYLMVHYPLDVAAGALLGILSGVLSHHVVESRELSRRFERP
jgi:undecaprenyl-diphosphatase